MRQQTIKKAILLPASIVEKAMAPVRWVNQWDRNRLNTFIRKLYLGGF